MTITGAHQVVTAARVALGEVLDDGQRATLEDIARALRLAHRALGVAEQALAPGVDDAFARAPDDTLPRGSDDGSTTRMRRTARTRRRDWTMAKPKTPLTIDEQARHMADDVLDYIRETHPYGGDEGVEDAAADAACSQAETSIRAVLHEALVTYKAKLTQ